MMIKWEEAEFIHDWARRVWPRGKFKLWWHLKRNIWVDSTQLPGSNWKSAGPLANVNQGEITCKISHLKGKHPLCWLWDLCVTNNVRAKSWMELRATQHMEICRICFQLYHQVNVLEHTRPRFLSWFSAQQTVEDDNGSLCVLPSETLLGNSMWGIFYPDLIAFYCTVYEANLTCSTSACNIDLHSSFWHGLGCVESFLPL